MRVGERKRPGVRVGEEEEGGGEGRRGRGRG